MNCAGPAVLVQSAVTFDLGPERAMMCTGKLKILVTRSVGVGAALTAV